MNTVEVSIRIAIKPGNENIYTDKVPTKVDNGHFRLMVNKSDMFDINALEDAVLSASYHAMRDALTVALETATKEQAIAECERRGAGYQVVEHKSDYLVDGEVGRFRFSLFDVIGPEGEMVFKGSGLWPARTGPRVV